MKSLSKEYIVQMLIHKTGIVLSPKHYKDWHAECVGDPTDTGGIHVVLRHSDH